MLRSEIVDAVNRVHAALKVCNLGSTLQEMRRSGPEKASDATPIFQAFQRYQHEAAKFGPAERRLVAIFGLQILEDPAFWSSALQGQDRDSRSRFVHRTAERLEFVNRFLPSVAELLIPAYDDVVGEQSRTSEREDGRLEVIKATLHEPAGTSSNPERLVKMLEGLQALYSGCARIKQEGENTLVVAGCDSGSDKIFDFLGIASVVSEARKIILDVWDRVIFYREKQFGERIDLVLQSLPVIAHVDSLATSGACSREDAELIKRRIVAGVTGLLEAGVSFGDVSSRTHFDPKHIMAPQPKLLAPVTQYDDDDSEQPAQSLEDVKKMEALFKRMSPQEREAWLSGLDADETSGSET